MMRVYRALLHLYPASFRAEYGGEMARMFARRLQASGAVAAPALLLGAFFEILFNAAAVHWDILRQDLRYTARTLARAPGFTLVAVAVVALGIGANTAVFSVTDRVLIRPLPFADSARLVKLWEHPPGYSRMELSPLNYRDWKRMSTAFEGMGMFYTNSVNLVGRGDPLRLQFAAVSPDLLPLLGAAPLFGRVFSAEDGRDGAPGTVLLSYRVWQSVFGGDGSVLGRKVILDGEPCTVIGVMPREFLFPSREAGLWMPTRFSEGAYQDRNDNFLDVIARLKPGVSLPEARAQMSVVAAQLARQYPKEDGRIGATVNRLRDEISEQSRLLLAALSGAALCVLLIACANLANLLLVRALARQKELAVRTAIGAGRERLVRQLVTESLLVAALGGVLGVLVAAAAVPLLVRLVPQALPIPGDAAVDVRVLGFAALLTGATGVLFGVVPALRISGSADLRGLHEGARVSGGRRGGLRAALVITEVTLSVVLLVSAGLLMRALWRVQAVDPGFRAEGVLTLRTALPAPKYGPAAVRDAFHQRVLAGIRALPGVSHAAYISYLPMVMGGGIWPVIIGGETEDRSESHTASMRFVTPGFFAALGIPLHAGRDVSESDTLNRPMVAVVSDSFARRYWPRQNPLGRRFQFAFLEREVVGVVGDIRVRGLERTSEPQVYLPSRQQPNDSFTFYMPKDLVVQASGGPGPLLSAIRRIIRSADPEQPISDVQTLEEIVEDQTGPRSLQVRLILAFAAAALLLAGIGIHGLLSFAVSTRAPEIGVRIALGAQRRDILGMVLRQGFALAAAGVALGAALGYAAGRAIQALLVGVTPGDAPVLLVATGLAFVMTMAGSLLPALRAVRLDPIQAMRAE